MKTRPLFIQLFTTFVPIIIIGLVLLILLANSATKEFYYNQTKEDLKVRAGLIAEWVQIDYRGNRSIQEFTEIISRKGDMRVTFIDRNGIVIGDSHEDPKQMDNHKDRPEIIDAFENQEGTSQRYSHTIDKNMIYLAIPFKIMNEKWIVRLSVPTDSLDQAINDLEMKIIIIGLLVGLSLLILSFYTSKQVTEPLGTMIDKIENYVETLVISDPMPTPNTTELASLSRSLNQMAMELDKRIKQIQRERNDREYILSSMQNGLIALDTEYNIISINNTAIEYLNISSGAVIGKSAKEVIKYKKIRRFMKKTLYNNQKIEDEVAIKDKKKRYFLIYGTPLIRKNETSGILIVLNDITFQKQLESIRQDFVANVSHELKTPITSIVGYIEIIKNSEVEESDKKLFLTKVLNQTNRMNAIIDDLLRLSKIESHEEDGGIEISPHYLLPIFNGAKEDVTPKCDKNGNSVRIKCPIDLMINCDPQILQEAVYNLLENAVKYGESGSEIVIGIFITDNFNIYVDNYGQKISKRHKDKIFQRFYRIDKSRDRKAGGTGLGLAIVKHIAFVHDGDVSVERTKEEKTRFKLILPIT